MVHTGHTSRKQASPRLAAKLPHMTRLWPAYSMWHRPLLACLVFANEKACCKTYQMTYYLFIYDVPKRSCVILKYSSVENCIWRKTQSKFGKYASLATLTYSRPKAIRM